MTNTHTPRTSTYSLTTSLAVAATLLLAPALGLAADGKGNSDKPASTDSSASSGRLGVGAEVLLGSDRGPNSLVAVTYDFGDFYVEGVLGMSYADRGDALGFSLGGRGFYVLHRHERADFAVGGGVSALISHTDGTALSGSDQTGTLGAVAPAKGTEGGVNLELGAKVRIFLVENVAMNAFVGYGADFASGSNISMTLGGRVIGGAGFAYYF